MEFPEKDMKTFVELGLSHVETKIFLTLVQSGTLKVERIAQVSNISRGDVYRNLSKLQNDGLVEKQISRPAMFRATPINDAIEGLINRQKLKQKQIQLDAANLLDKYNRKKCPPSDKSGFVFVPSREALIKHLTKAIANTKNSIDVSTSCKRLTSAGFTLSENLLEAWNRGVKGRAVINVNGGTECENIKDFWITPSAKIKYLPKIPRTVMAMYDRKEIFVFIEPTAQLNESPALWSNVPSLVAMAEDYFELLWCTAMENPNYQLDE